MQFKKTLEIKANHKQVVINVADILYIKASVNDCYIHVTSGSVYKTRSNAVTNCYTAASQKQFNPQI